MRIRERAVVVDKLTGEQVFEVDTRNVLLFNSKELKTNTVFTKILDFLNKYKFYIIIIALLLLVFYYSNKTSSSTRISKSIKNIEDKYSNQSSYQTDFCNNNLVRRKVCDYYIASSSYPYLTGLQYGDYVSLKMIQKIILFGARYLELEIFSETLENDTIPVVSKGFGKGEWKLSQNYLLLSDCLESISEIAFSEKYIDNFKDPLFLFLNIKTDNVETLDKVYELILKYFYNRLLGSKYRNQKANIAQLSMCKLMDKLVIFSSDGYQGSKLKDLINLSTTNSNLKRITFSELPIGRKTESDFPEPDFYVTSNFISFHKGIQNDYIQSNTPDINFIQYGISEKFVLKINGARNPGNNNLYKAIKIKQVLKNRLYLDTKDLVDELEGNSVSIRAFNQTKSIENLEDRNKFKLTIVVPDDGIMSKNYNPYNAFKLGCQFVSMFYHVTDNNMTKYKNFFKKVNYRVKPSNLIYIPYRPRQPSMESKYPTPVIENPFGILPDFKHSYQEIALIPKAHSKLLVVNDKNIAKISPNQDKSLSSLIVTEGLNDNENSVSFKLGDKYLSTTDNCCFVTFKPRPVENFEEQKQFDLDASFYAVVPTCNDGKYISFIVAKDENYKKNDRDYKGRKYNQKYYLQYRPSFNFKTNLYVKKTNFYKKITTLTSEDGVVSIFRAMPKDGAFSPGDIAVKGTSMPKFETKIYKGAVKPPIDYDIVWSNRRLDVPNKVSVWKPIPPNGFIPLGYVFSNGLEKPDNDAIGCVASEYLKQVNLGPMFWGDIERLLGNALTLWSVPGSDYIVVNNSKFKPSEFDTPVYNIDLKDKNYKNRLFIDTIASNNSNYDSSCFKVKDLMGSEDNQPDLFNLFDRQDFSIEGKVASTYFGPAGNTKCVSLPRSMWSLYYNEEDKDHIITEKSTELVADNCRDKDYFGTKFTMYNDDTIRLADNTAYCMTHTPGGTVSLDDKVYLEKCRKDRKGQEFYFLNGVQVQKMVNNRVQNSCLTLSKNKLKMLSCSNSKNDKQNWRFELPNDEKCLKIYSTVYLFTKIKRGNTNMGNKTKGAYVDDRLLSTYDKDYFHAYLRGEIKDEKDGSWLVELYNDLGKKYVPKGSRELFLEYKPKVKQLVLGTQVLCRYQGLINNGYTDDNVKWDGTIIEKKDNKFMVLLSVNAIELNPNRESLGRPRSLITAELGIYDLILKEQSIECINNNN
jgi:hypothetical protein